MALRNTGLMRSPIFGFTLIELMIVVGIVAILARLAFNSYQGSVRKARRADVQGVMLDRVQGLERFYTNNNTYVAYPVALADPRVSDYYTLAYSVTPTATAYTISATPKGPQASDSCGVLRIDQTGTKTPGNKCWQ